MENPSDTLKKVEKILTDMNINTHNYQTNEVDEGFVRDENRKLHDKMISVLQQV